MKVAMRVMAVAAMLAMASVAKADTAVWFEASSPLGGAGIDVQGGPSSVLALSCDATLPTVCTWTISIAFVNDGPDSPLLSWASDLVLGPSAVGKIDIVPGSFAYPPPNPTPGFTFGSHAPAAGPSINQGQNLLTNANGLDTSFTGVNGGTVASFILRKTKQAGNINLDTIGHVAGGVEWANADGAYPVINGIVDGGAAGTDLGAAMSIRNFPEPSSLALLGLGALALIRRR
jgi:hypothetical protein